MNCLHPVKIALSDDQREKRRSFLDAPISFRFATYQYVPCGKCEACLVNRRSQWTFRLKQELRDAISAYFITLTYDDINLPVKNGLPFVNKRDVQLFLKRLRFLIRPFKIRYFCVSEYGPKNFRPHYHMILFDFPNELKNKLNEYLEDSWNLGFIRVDPVNSARIHYVSGYCLDFTQIPKNLKKPFMLCSRRPGIGYRFLDVNGVLDYCAANTTDLWTVADNDSAFKVKIPRYYKDKLFGDDLKLQIALQSSEFFSQHFTEISAKQREWLNRKGIQITYKSLHTPYPGCPYDLELQEKRRFQKKVIDNSKNKSDI